NQGPLALHTFPRYLSGSRLTMDVDSHAWLQQASFLKSEILKKLKPYGVSDLLMRIGRIEALREEHQPEVAPSELTREESDFLDEVLSGIDDADLEDHIRGAMQAWSRKRRAFRFRSRLADE
nr:DUF721 domain-containing protein [Desulfobacterales bacterium]